jgi:orotidine-5'-phosphate decarboxylase
VDSSKIVLALDGMTSDDALYLTYALRDVIWGVKLNDLFVREGPFILRTMKKATRVLVDLKTADIPATNVNTMRALSDCGADAVTLTASCGLTSLRAASWAFAGEVFAVTCLTSMTDAEVRMVYNSSTRQDVVRRLASLAHLADCKGVVCGASDFAAIPAGLKILLPGFRPQGKVAGDDQQVLAGYKDTAYAALVVVGRPITAAADPVAAAREINEGIARAA